MCPKSVHTNFIYISVYFYKMCWVLQSNVSILYFLRNYYKDFIICTFINVHFSTCKFVNRFFLSVRPVNQLQGYLAHYAYSLRSTLQGMYQCIGCSIFYLPTFLEKRLKKNLTWPGGSNLLKGKLSSFLEHQVNLCYNVQYPFSICLMLPWWLMALL